MHDFPNEVELLELNRSSDMKIMGWTPPQRPAWVKAYMRMPGHTRVQLFLLTTLAISSVTSTGLLIFRTVNNTSDANILHSVESLEVGNAKLRLRVTGKSTTEVLTNLKPMLKDWANGPLNEKSSVSTGQVAK